MRILMINHVRNVICAKICYSFRFQYSFSRRCCFWKPRRCSFGCCCFWKPRRCSFGCCCRCFAEPHCFCLAGFVEPCCFCCYCCCWNAGRQEHFFDCCFGKPSRCSSDCCCRCFAEPHCFCLADCVEPCCFCCYRCLNAGQPVYFSRDWSAEQRAHCSCCRSWLRMWLSQH